MLRSYEKVGRARYLSGVPKGGQSDRHAEYCRPPDGRINRCNHYTDYNHTNMGKPTGRPPLGAAKRDRQIKVSFNDTEFDIIDIKASRAGLSRSEYVRAGALNAEVNGVLSDEERMLLYELKKLGPNLNQIAHHANAEGYLSVAAKAEDIVDCIAGFILKLKNRIKT